MRSCSRMLSVVVRVGHLRLEHPELGQVPARLGLLGPEGRPEVVDPAVGRAGRLEVQLSGLREVRRAQVEVGHLEEGAGALADGAGEDRGVDEQEPFVVEEPPERHDGGIPDAHHRVRPGGAQPEVAVLEQEVDAVLLLGDRVVEIRVLHDVDRGHGELEARRRALVAPYRAAYDHRGFHFKSSNSLRARRADRVFLGHALDPARAVAQLEEMQLPLRSEIVEPAVDLDVPVDVAADVGDEDTFHCELLRVGVLRTPQACRGGHALQTYSSLWRKIVSSPFCSSSCR